jgi:hypothetical protein
VNSSGFVWRDMFVRLPKDFTADMINSNPKAWSKLQARGKALKKFDRVVPIAWDESWMALMFPVKVEGVGEWPAWHVLRSSRIR